MKRVVAILTAVGLLAALVGATPAGSATPVERRIATLEKKIAAQQKTINALKKQATEARDFGILAAGVSVCLTAVTADALQNTWSVVNQVAGRGVFGAPLSLNDQGICNALRVTRQESQVPPNASVFGALLAIFRGSTIPHTIERAVERLF